MAEEQQSHSKYQVLARKYRPKTFADLIGQDAMVRTLTNAIENDRLAHAYILTGVRGIGKTSTARIIAKYLNGTGKDGNGPPTLDPDPNDDTVKAIEEGRHVDVLEMDAASRTGVGDIRELIEGVQYRPVSAKYKIYIIDEVHMLSTAAFNALLKTLEEPPEHVKFIFATTEIRKVPITVLSRCQRFDLRRVDVAELAAHLQKITPLEGGKITEAAAITIARAADGSVRDGLSLLDQALVITNKEVTEEVVADMLGLVDKNQTYDLMDACLKGAGEQSLLLLNEMYKNGADPLTIIQDLLSLTHWITRLKVTPNSAQEMMSEIDITRGAKIADQIPMSILGRTWQMLLKAVSEIQYAPRPLAAAEMVLVRLCYMADLPTPEALLAQTPNTAVTPPTPPNNPTSNPANDPVPATPTHPSAPVSSGGPTAALAVVQNPVAQTSSAPLLQKFEDMIAILEEEKEAILVHHLTCDVHLVKFEAGHMELRLTKNAPADLPHKIGQKLKELTGNRWMITISNKEGEKTIEAQKNDLHNALKQRLAEDPLVAQALKNFEGATISNIYPKGEDLS